MTGVTAAEAVPAAMAGVPKPTASVMTASARRLRVLFMARSPLAAGPGGEPAHAVADAEDAVHDSPEHDDQRDADRGARLGCAAQPADAVRLRHAHSLGLLQPL